MEIKLTGPSTSNDEPVGTETVGFNWRHVEAWDTVLKRILATHSAFVDIWTDKNVMRQAEARRLRKKLGYGE